jgi:hypothetical protein
MSGPSEAEQEDLYAAMRGWARDLCLDTETPVEVVERIIAAHTATAVKQAEQRLAARLREALVDYFGHAEPCDGRCDQGDPQICSVALFMTPALRAALDGSADA